MTNAVALAQGGSNNVTMRNRIINGAMVIDQRSNGGSTTYGSGSSTNGNYYGYNSCDRWFAQSYTSAAGNGFTFTQAQNQGSVTPPAGFSKYLGVTVTYSQATISNSGLFVGARQYIEGYNTADLSLGTANAKALTLSFWVRCSVTGTYAVNLTEYNGTAYFQSSYTVNSANTWEQKTISVSACTIGTWATTNAASLGIDFILGASADRTGGTANTWTSSGYNSLSGCTNLAATNGATWQVTGVQLEAGTTASPFEYRQYGTELALCQRYYQQLGSAVGCASGATQYTGAIQYFVPMRTTPTVSVSAAMSITDTNAIDATQSSASVTIVNGNRANQLGMNFNLPNFSGLTSNKLYITIPAVYSNGILLVSAEL